jgi:hypothetical protein
MKCHTPRSGLEGVRSRVRSGGNEGIHMKEGAACEMRIREDDLCNLTERERKAINKRYY